jgi:cytosine/adenosine deaminase-related metal-dependent hydrolase
MDPMDALLAATRNIAQAYRKDDELGTIEPGKRADLLVLDGDPLTDVENYRRITQLVKDGAVVDRERLPEDPVLTRRVTSTSGTAKTERGHCAEHVAKTEVPLS